MIVYTTSTSGEDLLGILDLQHANLAENLPTDEIQSQGFVTVEHTYEQLLKLNSIEKHIVIKKNEMVIGYLLAMTPESRADIPVLVPMFDLFNNTNFKDRRIADYNYIVVGQVCISKLYRGKGLLGKCYAEYRNRYKNKYDFAITEIAKTNARSLNAHKKIGFVVINTYTSSDSIEWVVVVWDWKNGT